MGVEIMSKKIFLVIFTVLGIAVCAAGVFVMIAVHRKSDAIADFSYNKDGTVTLGEGYVAHGFYTMDEELVDAGGQVVCENGRICGQIHFQQNADASNYGLLLLCDFRQQEFYVEGEAYRFYRFSLEGDTEVRIPIELPVDGAAYEMAYLIVPEPDEKEEEFFNGEDIRWDFMQAMQANVYTSRFVIADENGMTGQEPDRVYVDASRLAKIDQRAVFDVVKSADDISVFPSAKGHGKAGLLMGEALDKKAWAVIAFCDWEQVEVKDGDLVRYYSSADGGGSRYEEITFPDVEEAAVYQAFAYGLSDRSSVLVFPSFRIKLNRCYERPAGRE